MPTFITPSAAVVVIITSQVTASSEITISIVLSARRVNIIRRILSSTKRRTGPRHHGHNLDGVKLRQVAGATAAAPSGQDHLRAIRSASDTQRIRSRMPPEGRAKKCKVRDALLRDATPSRRA